MGVTTSTPLPAPAPSSWADRWLRPLAVASLVVNVLIVVTGGVVRLTGSGLGCPTWPRCTEESFTPHGAMGIHSAIEFGNRMVTFLIAAVAIATFVAAWRFGRPPSRGSPSSSPSASPRRPSSAASPCSPTSTRGRCRSTCWCRWR